MDEQEELAGEECDIHDPFQQGEDRYRACRDEIKRCLTKGVDRLLATLSGMSGRSDPSPSPAGGVGQNHLESLSPEAGERAAVRAERRSREARAE